MTIFLCSSESSDFESGFFQSADSTATHVRRTALTRSAIAHSGVIGPTPAILNTDQTQLSRTPQALMSRLSLPPSENIYVTARVYLPLLGEAGPIFGLRHTGTGALDVVDSDAPTAHIEWTVFRRQFYAYQDPEFEPGFGADPALELGRRIRPIGVQCGIELRKGVGGGGSGSREDRAYFTNFLNLTPFSRSSTAYTENVNSRSVIPGTLQRYDFAATNIGLANGRLRLYLDGKLLVDANVDYTEYRPPFISSPHTPDPDNFRQIFINHKPDNLVLYGGFGAFGQVSLQPAYFSEIIVADEDTRMMSLATLAPEGAGTINEWSGSYAAVDETTLNEADYIETNVVGDDFQCTLTNLPTTAVSVVAVQVGANHETTGGPASGVLLGINSGGTVDVEAADFVRIMETNPITSSAWTPAVVNAMQIDIRSGPP